jgi:hypothetical protein
MKLYFDIAGATEESPDSQSASYMEDGCSSNPACSASSNQYLLPPEVTLIVSGDHYRQSLNRRLLSQSSEFLPKASLYHRANELLSHD